MGTVDFTSKLFLHPEKCEFCKEQIEYLGLVISENKVSMDPVKVTGVQEWPTPENRTDIQCHEHRVGL